MSPAIETIEGLVKREYNYGFYTDVETGSVARCLEELPVVAEPVPLRALQAVSPEAEAAQTCSPYGGNEGGIEIYWREIGQVKLLTRREEIELAARIQRGDQKAREQMIKANLRLVVKIARGYEGLGLPLLDLISEGNIGLMTAVERFDPNKGAKVSTYAALWIKQRIRRALCNQSRTIRLPANLVVDKIATMKRIAMRMSEELGREPTDDELAERLELPVSKVSQLQAISVRPASLDAPIGDNDSIEFGEIVADERAFTPYDILNDMMFRNHVRQMLSHLDSRTATIINLRFGLDGRTPQTLDKIGKRFRITRERIRQIQDIALVKLRRLLERHDRINPFPEQRGSPPTRSRFRSSGTRYF